MAVMSNPELSEIACLGSMSPCEDDLGKLYNALVNIGAIDPNKKYTASARPDPEDGEGFHYFVEPAETCPIGKYEQDLAETRPRWSRL